MTVEQDISWGAALQLAVDDKIKNKNVSVDSRSCIVLRYGDVGES